MGSRLSRGGHQVGEISRTGPERRSGQPRQVPLRDTGADDLANVGADIVPIGRGQSKETFPEEIRDPHPHRPGQRPSHPGHGDRHGNADLAPEFPPGLTSELCTGPAWPRSARRRVRRVYPGLVRGPSGVGGGRRGVVRRRHGRIGRRLRRHGRIGRRLRQRLTHLRRYRRGPESLAVPHAAGR